MLQLWDQALILVRKRIDLLSSSVTVLVVWSSNRLEPFHRHCTQWLTGDKAVVNASFRSAGLGPNLLKGFIFLGTPHKGSHLTSFGLMQSAFTYWMGSSTSLLEVVKPGSQVNKQLHDHFMSLLTGEGPGVQNTVCVFETLKEAVFSFPILTVRTVPV